VPSRTPGHVRGPGPIYGQHTGGLPARRAVPGSRCHRHEQARDRRLRVPG
jgi:hypothetical protein